MLRLGTCILNFHCFQVGGWTQVYGNMLSFATIRGASHEAPFSQPERSLVLFKSFLEGRPLPETFWSTDQIDRVQIKIVRSLIAKGSSSEHGNWICLLFVSCYIGLPMLWKVEEICKHQKEKELKRKKVLLSFFKLPFCIIGSNNWWAWIIQQEAESKFLPLKSIDIIVQKYSMPKWKNCGVIYFIKIT